MGMNNSKKTIIEQRRALVAGLRLKGRTQREIINNLTDNGFVNPKSNKPWSLGLINSDIEKIEQKWQEESVRDISKHKARQLAEINEIKKFAWTTKEYAIILKAIDQEANILGTKAAIRQEHTGKDGNPMEITDTTAKSRLLARLVEEASKDGSFTPSGEPVGTTGD
jgi:hypothetical protein